MAKYTFKDGKTYLDGQPVDLTSKPKGMGDVVASAANIIGVTPSEGCGCAKRKEVLNSWTPAWAAKLITRILPS